MAYLVLPLIVLVYLKFPANRRIEYLLFFSLLYLFSLNVIGACVALLMGIVCNYAAKYIANTENINIKRITYYLTLAVFIGFFVIYRIFLKTENILLVGFSFYLLQLLGLLTDAYRGTLTSKPLLKEVLLYQTFSPKLLQGPIEQYQRFSEQIQSLTTPTKEQYKKALLYLLLGLSLKLCVADRLHIAALAAFENNNLHGLTIWLSICFYSIVLYADFAGYTYIAQAVALLFGYQLPENFNKPFSSRSITELWRRWHMSLMQWLQQYVFMPFGYGLRYNKWLFPVTPILTTFILSALWHGFSFHFLFWGIFHAGIIIIELRTRKWQWLSKLPTLVLALNVFILFSVGNVFFNSHSVKQVWTILSQMFSAGHFFPKSFNLETLAAFIGNGDQESILNLYSYSVLAIMGLFCEYNFKRAYLQTSFKYYTIILLLLFSILIFGNMHESPPFIYRQF